MVTNLVTAAYLLLLGISDIRKRTVSFAVLAAGLVFSVLVGIGKCKFGSAGWMTLMTGLLPGSGMLFLAWMTQKVGYADGIVLISMGLLYGLRAGFVLLCGSLFLLSISSVVLLALRKVGRETKMPYLPFLAMAFVLWMILS